MIKAYDEALKRLKTLSLNGMIKCFDEVIQESENEKSSYVGF
jgi:hypothetical protein